LYASVVNEDSPLCPALLGTPSSDCIHISCNFSIGLSFALRQVDVPFLGCKLSPTRLNK